jgi:gliding motility-associated-like protein
LIIDTQTGVVTDGGMAIYSGTCGSLVLIECDDDDSGNGMMPKIDNSSLTPGSTIYIRFWEYGNDNLGTFGICVTEPAPPSDNALCSGADPFCTGIAYNFPANVNAGVGQSGPDYGCLCSQPNPVWYYLRISNAGSLSINIASSCGDVDYAAWGPFPALTCDNADLTSTVSSCGGNLSAPAGNMVDCAFSTSATETLDISNALTGQYYLVMITNYANCTGNILFNQTSGAGSTDCSIVAPPVTNNGPLCTGQTLELTVTSPVAGATYAWTGPGGWNSNVMNPTISNVTLANAGIYSLVITVGGVSSAPVTTTVVITALPNVSISYSGSPWCKSAGVQSATLTGTGPYTGGTYTSTAGLTINSTTGQITPSTSTAGTYTVTYTTPGSTCTATATATVTITNPPTAVISYSGSPWCTTAGTQTVTLTGTNAYTGGTYTASPAGLTLNSTTGQITPSTSTPGTYTITYTIAAASGCSAVNATTTVTINAVDNPSFNYTPSTMCQTGSDQSAVITGGATGTFTASPAGLVFLNASTGLIDVSASANNSYTLTFTTNGACPANSTFAVNVTSAPNATFSYAGPYCSNGTDPSPSFPIGIGASAGTFSASPAGLVFVSTATGQIDVSASTGGTYTVTNSVAAAGGCAAATATSTVTITALPTAVISYSGSPWCTSAGVQAPTLTGTGTFTGGTYTASPAGLTIDAATGQITPSTSLFNTYTVNYTIAAAGGCPAVLATTSVTITALPTATISYSGSPWCIFSGTQAVSLAGTNNFTGGTYSSTPGLSISSTSGQITPATSTPGVYTVTYTIAATGGCTQVTATTSVTITALPTAVISYSGSPWCTSAGVQAATLTGSGAYTGGTYTSTPGLTLDATTGQITPSTSTGGTYTVTYTAPASSGCPAVPATTNVTITAMPTANIINLTGTNLLTCTTTAINVNATGSTNYTWNGGSTPNSASNSFTTPGTYTVTVSSSNGCTGTSSITISQDATLPSAMITNNTGSTVLNCITNVVNVTTTGGNTYHWDGGATPSSGANSFTLPGIYTVTVTSTNGCTATNSITITQVEPVVLSLVSVNPDHCAQGIGAATVSAVGGSGTYTYTWDGTPQGASANNLFAGTYQVIASDGQCNDMITVVVGNVSGPIAAFEPVPDSMFRSNPVFSFHNGSSNASTYSWSFGDGNLSTVESPTHHYYGEGLGFIVSLEVTDSYGCKDTVSHEIAIIEDLNIWIPNTFTPNGDDVNDVFKPRGVGYSLKGYEMTIYDRFGKQQFYSNEFEKGWDGRIDGKKLNINNVFSYRIVVYDLKGKDHFYNGRVTLLGSKAAGN